MTDTLPYRKCAGIMLLNPEGLIFTGERIDTPGAWQMPQGGIDPGETPREAAFRELEEEIGVPQSAIKLLAETADWVTYDLPPSLLGKVWQGKYRGQKQHWALMQLNAPESVINIHTKHPEFMAWRWSSPAEVIRDIVPFKRDVYKTVIDEFAPYINQ
ncbi:RNA pyrophosphohydrolase [Kordiimonas sediminis]|uniref:RNA pyrophosphohydrolase n=1 Tax=Kordiimonas sediminis TaxID=1735581 RepID=A0A919APR0_9PROT|nr:RNA pyrophosphohydrolase [Kordiimonas sediminis]GHF20393.1 RNA pyrophosphohydrolase [Kordiimonas sediminis]